MRENYLCSLLPCFLLGVPWPYNLEHSALEALSRPSKRAWLVEIKVCMLCMYRQTFQYIVDRIWAHQSLFWPWMALFGPIKIITDKSLYVPLAKQKRDSFQYHIHPFVVLDSGKEANSQAIKNRDPVSWTLSKSRKSSTLGQIGQVDNPNTWPQWSEIRYSYLSLIHLNWAFYILGKMFWVSLTRKNQLSCPPPISSLLIREMKLVKCASVFSPIIFIWRSRGIERG